MSKVHGPGSRCTKPPFYDLVLPLVSIITTRSKVLHDKRRRIWDQAFSIKGMFSLTAECFECKDLLWGTFTAIKQYEERVRKYCSQLEQQMTASVGSAVNLSSWFDFFSFDVMGDLSFGKSFNVLSTGKKHFAIDLMDNGMTLLGLFTPTPWLARLGFSIPRVATGWKKMFVWSDEQMQERLESKAKRTDITSWLIEASKQANSMEQDRNWLNGDAFGIVIAGSDTTVSTLVTLLRTLRRSTRFERN